MRRGVFGGGGEGGRPLYRVEGLGRGNQAHGSYFCHESSYLSQVDKTLQCFIVLVQLSN